MKHKNTIHLSQNFIFSQSKWKVFFQFFTKLIRYLFALQVEFLNIFNQTENNCILLADASATVHCRLTDENVQKHDFLTNENAQRHNFLTEVYKNFFIQHEIVCSQSNLWLSNYLQWQHLNQTLCLKICFLNVTTVLSVCLECDSCKLIDKSRHQIVNLSCWLIFNKSQTWIAALCRY